MTDKTKATEEAIDDVAAIAFSMREIAEMIECSNTVQGAQCLATGLVAMAEKVLQRCEVAIDNLRGGAA